MGGWKNWLKNKRLGVERGRGEEGKEVGGGERDAIEEDEGGGEK